MKLIPTLRHAAAAAGLLAVAWVGAGYVPGHPLALAMTALIGALYIAGLAELQRFSRATQALAEALETPAAPPPTLADWLERLPPALRPAVRRRLEGDAVALPGPTLAPSLAGLLVLLGMLGTFLGMVLTLRGTGAALESATDLAAVRNSLVAPVQGLGLAFGTSVAGVAASAMLSAVSALCRRERLQIAQRLDALAAAPWRSFSRQHQREAALDLLQRQADLLPTLVEGLQATMQNLQAQAAQAQERQLAAQQQFQQQMATALAGLADSVGRSLQASLAEGSRSATQAVQAATTQTMAGLAGTFEQRTAGLLDGVTTRFDQQSQALMQRLAQAQAEQQAMLAAAEQQRASALAAALQAQADGLQREWQQAGAEVARLVQAATEAPRAAAELVGSLREQLSASLAHDQQLLAERAQLLQTVESLLDGVNRAATEQRAAIDALVASAGALIAQAGQRLEAQTEAQAVRLDGLATQLGAGSIELASLGDAFTGAVQQFGDSNDRLAAQLQRIEAALGQAMARSDDQLAYTVAQAREVIDLSLLSQKQIVEELQRLASRAEALAP